MKSIRTVKAQKFLSDFYSEFPQEKDSVESRVKAISLEMKIKKLRMINNLTQKELAKKSGISQDKISKIESGRHNPTIGTLHKIAAGMGKELKIELV